MTLTIHSTEKIVELNGVPARIWEGETDSAVFVTCFITRIAVDKSYPEEVHKQFYEELTQCSEPAAAAQSFPLKMIL